MPPTGCRHYYRGGGLRKLDLTHGRATESALPDCRPVAAARLVGPAGIVAGGDGVAAGPARLAPAPAALSAALSWACFHHHQQLAERLPAELDGSRMEVTARIRGLPQPTDTGWRFEIEQVRSLEGLTLPLTRVHWFGGEAVSPGEHWRFEL